MGLSSFIRFSRPEVWKWIVYGKKKRSKTGMKFNLKLILTLSIWNTCRMAIWTKVTIVVNMVKKGTGFTILQNCVLKMEHGAIKMVERKCIKGVEILKPVIFWGNSFLTIRVDLVEYRKRWCEFSFEWINLEKLCRFIKAFDRLYILDEHFLLS